MIPSIKRGTRLMRGALEISTLVRRFFRDGCASSARPPRALQSTSTPCQSGASSKLLRRRKGRRRCARRRRRAGALSPCSCAPQASVAAPETGLTKPR